ncbi:radical SAM family heme chaperone HemW [Rhodophyticola sp. MJ-SS7]|nr:radical SAM family heme chaperone HemW [Rhodophyticola sp. MJ-SS7]MDU8942541.1 radical SAM family heme chaperone HemW [Rhodophyticola sp. MJ-SS7]
MADQPPPSFGIYVHWPFCAAKCPYCDFNSHVSAGIDHDAWRAAYRAEIARLATELPDRVVSTIFFGGGTPSLMEPATVAQVIDDIRAGWRTTNDLEITLEANPTSVEKARFQDLRAAGVNRVSLGLQALDDDDLKRLGRLHSVDEGLAALDTALTVFGRASFDLIYARQDQSPETWERELRRALSFGTSHLSLYQLTIEPGTAFGARHAAGGLSGLPDQDRAADMFDITQSLTETAGLPAYETSNHARPGEESRHNMIYWTGGDYAGIGPGAHGRLTIGGQRFATETRRAPGAWLEDVRSGSGETPRALLSKEEEILEAFVMGLRLRDGISADRLQSYPIEAEIYKKINKLAEDGWLERDQTALRLTPKGRPLLDAILREIFA